MTRDHSILLLSLIFTPFVFLIGYLSPDNCTPYLFTGWICATVTFSAAAVIRELRERFPKDEEATEEETR